MWSNHLIEESRKALSDVNNSELKDLEVICLKNKDGRFGMVLRDMIAEGIASVVSSDYSGHWEYETLEEMLQDGWIVD